MSGQELAGLLAKPFYENFAERMAVRVQQEQAIGLLYGLITQDDPSLSRAVRHKVLFRGAYVLETLYFAHPESFTPYLEAFCECDFAACADPSARRHFTKIMAHVLRDYTPDAEALERIAASAAEWAVDPQMKVAVRIWAMEVLALCRDRVDWVPDVWEDMLETLAHDASPAIANRLRKSWRQR